MIVVKEITDYCFKGGVVLAALLMTQSLLSASVRRRQSAFFARHNVLAMCMTMALIGFSLEMFVAHVMINKFYGFWLHTRTIGKIPLIEGILSTPSAHRVHHGMNDIYLDRNHGGILMIFDRMFDSRHTASWRNKLRLWFMPTGWRPADLERKMPRQEVSLQNFTKFNSPTSLGSRRLTLVWAPP